MPKVKTRVDLLNIAALLALHEITDNGDIDTVLSNYTENLDLIINLRYLNPRLRIPKSSDWVANILPSYDDRRFKATLRMSRKSFSNLLNIVSESPEFKFKCKRNPLAIDLQLAIALFRLGNDGSAASYYNVGHKFGVGDGGTISNCTFRFINCLLAMKDKYLKWPSPEERIEIKTQMANALPNCIGFVDGSHVPLFEAPVDKPETYYSRKQRYTIQIQAVCDNNLKLRHVVVGYPGSVHDARVFNNSDFGYRPELFLSPGEWIAGDSAYKLSEWVITPYRDNSRVGSHEDRKKFNKHFSSYRVKIEQAFGILKNTFLSLKNLRIRVDEANGHRRACQWIMACCILYNISCPQDEIDFVLEEDAEEEMSNDYSTEALSPIGERKREALMRWVTEFN